MKKTLALLILLAITPARAADFQPAPPPADVQEALIAALKNGRNTAAMVEYIDAIATVPFSSDIYEISFKGGNNEILYVSKDGGYIFQADIIAVPDALNISRERRLQRGFNQCDRLAQAITQRYTIPLLPPHSVYRAPKPPQSTLSAADRAHNIRGAFRLDANVKDCKVVIIDDVSTTHSSIAELSRVLLMAGAAEVYACVVACNK